jgi:hypothetical protein
MGAGFFCLVKTYFPLFYKLTNVSTVIATSHAPVFC